MGRWTEESVAGKTYFNVPAIIVAYNIFMNAVDVMDQLRANNMTRRREKRLSMSMFGFVVDLAVHNAFAVQQQLIKLHNARATNKDNMKVLPMPTYGDFKRNLCEQRK